jgi:TolA-binding protein
VAPNAPTAPQALVLLARLCGERMQDPTRAASVYRYIVHRYPNTDAARFAAQRLPPSA